MGEMTIHKTWFTSALIVLGVGWDVARYTGNGWWLVGAMVAAFSVKMAGMTLAYRAERATPGGEEGGS